MNKVLKIVFFSIHRGCCGNYVPLLWYPDYSTVMDYLLGPSRLSKICLEKQLSAYKKCVPFQIELLIVIIPQNGDYKRNDLIIYHKDDIDTKNYNNKLTITHL